MGWDEHKQPSEWSGRVHGFDVYAVPRELVSSGLRWRWDVCDPRSGRPDPIAHGYAFREHDAVAAATLAAKRIMSEARP